MEDERQRQGRHDRLIYNKGQGKEGQGQRGLATHVRRETHHQDHQGTDTYERQGRAKTVSIETPRRSGEPYEDKQGSYVMESSPSQEASRQNVIM